MERYQLIAIIVVCLVVGHQANRADVLSSIGKASPRNAIDAERDASAEVEVYSLPDPDLKFCGGLGSVFKCTKPGCQRLRMWLDKPTQSCRLTEEYKLIHNPLYFAKLDVQRLLEKSKKFKETGCVKGSLFGGKDEYMYKCMRRMQQILRYLKFINKVEMAALANPKHIAYAYVSGDLFKGQMRTMSENIAAGFDKYVNNSVVTGLKYDKSWQKLREMRSLSDELARSSTNESKKTLPIPIRHSKGFNGYYKLSPTTQALLDDRASEEATYVSAAMLQMVDVELSQEQKEKILSAAQEHRVSSPQAP